MGRGAEMAEREFEDDEWSSRWSDELDEEMWETEESYSCTYFGSTKPYLTDHAWTPVNLARSKSALTHGAVASTSDGYQG